MPLVNKDPIPPTVRYQPLALIVKSNLLTFDGSWHVITAVSGSAADILHLPVSYDYLIHLDGSNNLVHPEDIRILTKTILKAPNEIHDINLRFISASREIKLLYIHGKFRKENNTNSLLTDSEIAELKKVRLDLKESRKRFKAAINVLPTVLGILKSIRNKKNEIIDFYCEWVSKSSEVIRGKNLTGLLLTKQFPYLKEVGIFTELVRTVETGNALDIEHFYDKEDVNAWFRYKAVKLDDGLFVSVEDITEWKQAQEQLIALKDELAQRATDKYLTLFNSIDEGCCIVEIIFDKEGTPFDFRYLDINPAFEKQTGINVTGKTLRQIVPQADDYLIKKYAEVSSSGIPVRLTYRSSFMERWYELYITPIGHWKDHHVAVLFNDITDRKRSEEAVLKSEKRKTFLLKLSDTIRTIQDPTKLQLTASTLLGEFLQADRVHYGEYYDDDGYVIIHTSYLKEGLKNVAGRYELTDFGKIPSELRTGNTVIIDDIQASPSLSDKEKRFYHFLSVSSFIAVPLVVNRKLAWTLNVISTSPRTWTNEEITLVKEVSKRTWDAVKRARAEQALRESEEKLSLALKAANMGIYEWKPEGRKVSFSETCREIFGLETGKPLPTHDERRLLIHPEDGERQQGILERATFTEKDFHIEYKIVRPCDGKVAWIAERGRGYKDPETGSMTIRGVVWDITEKHVIEERLHKTEKNYQRRLEKEVGDRTAELKESKELLQAIAESQTMSLSAFKAIRNDQNVIIDLEWRFANPVTEQLVGSAGLVGKRYADIYGPVKTEDMVGQYRSVIERGKGYDKEFYYTHKNTGRWLRRITVKLGDGLLVAEEDITTRKKAEIQLREQAHFIQSITNTIPDVVTVIDHITGNIEYANQDAMKLLGFEPNEVLSMSAEERKKLLPPEDLQSVTTYFERFKDFSDDKENSVEYRVINKEGEQVWLNMRGKVFRRDANDIPTHSLNICRNVTESKVAEQKLQEEHRRLKEAQSIGRVGSFEWNATTNEIIWSDEMYKIHGLEPQSEEVTWERVISFIHPEDQPWIIEKIENARKVRTKERVIHRLLRADGTVRYINRSFESFANDQGAITHISGTFQDITEIKEAELQLQKNFEILKQAEEVAGIGSWEFDRTLNKLYWSAGMYKMFELPEGSPVSPEIYLDFVVDEDRHIALRIINTLRDVHKPFEEILRIKVHEKIKTLKVKSAILRDETGKPQRILGVNNDITTIIESEKTLREQSHFINNVVETIPDLISVINLSTGELEYVNQGPFEQQGFETDKLLKMRWSERRNTLIHHDDLDLVNNYFHRFQFLDNDTANTVEYRAKAFGGEWCWFRAHGRVFKRDEHGAATHCVNVVQNINDYRKSQDELIRMKDKLTQQAENRYWQLFNSMDEGFCIIEMIFDENKKPIDFRYIEGNPAFKKLTKFKNPIGKTMRELVPDIEEYWMQVYGRVAITGEPVRFIQIARAMAGRWYEVYAFQPDEKKRNQVAILFNDITERRLIEQNLKDKQLKLEIAQCAARVGIWSYNPATKSGTATAEWMDLTGYPEPGEVWTWSAFLSLIHSDDIPSVEKAYHHSIKEQTDIDVEFRIIHRKRGHQWLLMRGSYIPSYNGENDSLMGSIIDITDRKAFEEQKDQFIGIASHELKTPVTSIKAYAEILFEMFTKSGQAKQASMMERLDGQINRLTKLINDLLDTTRIAGGRLTLELKPFDLNSLVVERIEELQRTSLHRLLFTSARDVTVVADRERIGQVLTNLISNAIKYSPSRSDVIVTTQHMQDHVRIVVRDFGIGMTEEAQKKIFQRFFRVNDVQTYTIPGLGLGLFIASEIVKQHKGTIGVESKPGEGSVFNFTLPL